MKYAGPGSILPVILFILFQIDSHWAQAQDPLVLDNPEKFYSHENAFQYKEDPGRIFSSADFYNVKFRPGFKQAAAKNFDFGLTRSAIWYKFSLVNATGSRWLIQAGNPTVEEVTLYVPRRNGSVDSTYLNFRKPVSERPWRNNKYLLSLSFPDSTYQEFYLRITSDHSMSIPPKIGTVESFFVRNHYDDIYAGVYLGFILVMALFNFFIFLSIRDISYLWYVLYVLCIGIVVSTHNSYPFDLFWDKAPWLNAYIDIPTSLAGVFAILFTMNFLNTKTIAPRLHKGLYPVMALYIIAGLLALAQLPFEAGVAEVYAGGIGSIYVFATAVYIYRQGYKPAKFYLLAWGTLLLCILIFVLSAFGVFDYSSFKADPLLIGSAFESLLLSFALADRFNTYKKEKEELVLTQNLLLEQKVLERTAALKETQEQLVQKEKLASLGQLTKSIAHEIQNPLNFVTNFSDLSKDLVTELEETPVNNEQKEILSGLKGNLEKVMQHGKRASNIVKSMMEHSRTFIEDLQPTDINGLCEEFGTLTYQRMRSGHRGFQCSLVQDYDRTIPTLRVSTKDVGRALSNILQNSFESVYEKSKQGISGYQPEVKVSTVLKEQRVHIVIRDNGGGIPGNIIGKIFFPFFSTKETGEGTGLGLSMAHDIIQAHGGDISVESRMGEGTAFTVVLPVDAG